MSADFWYNLETGVVEEGMVSPGYDRAGPFATREEAARAPEIIKERSRAWAAEEAADDSWGSTEGKDASGGDAPDADTRGTQA